MRNIYIDVLNTFKPERFFVFVSLLFGIAFLVLTPPFQSPDEINHFYKSYQISDGKLISKSFDHRLGGYIPKSFTEITKPFLGLRWNMNAKTSKSLILKQFSIPLNEDELVFVDFPNTALYSPISYIPQAFSIFILKNLNITPISIFYGARLFTLLIWILCIYIAIKITPIHKWLFVILALLPMSVFTNMSLSADVVTNIISFLLLAYILKLTFEVKKVKIWHYFTIVMLTILLALSKVVYIPLIFLFLLIPSSKFSDTRKYYLSFILLLIIGFGTAILWSKFINFSYIPYNDYNTIYRDSVDLVKCGNIQDQLNYILSHGFYIFDVFLNSIKDTFGMYYRGYIGTFGWLDTELPMWLIHLSYVIIIFAAIFEKSGISFNKNQRFIILAGFLGTISLVMLSQHLTWDCTGSKIIQTLQGRYFIPVFPLFFLMLSNIKYNKNQILTAIVKIFTVFVLTYSTFVLYTRYYISPDFKSVTIQCDAEKIVSEKYFMTSIQGVLLENAGSRSNKYSRSGDHSVELSSKQPFGCTFRYYNGNMGDIFNIEVWRYGKSGSIVLSGDSGKAFYFTSSEIVQTDSNGWNKLQLNFKLLSDMKGKEIALYLYNNSIDTCYFDDLSIAIH